MEKDKCQRDEKQQIKKEIALKLTVQSSLTEYCYSFDTQRL